ncbi:hypothetical protein [Mucilaginibacter aquaedulcis]|jgi:hypothetical protein|uniref:hypothetical protein n=1 Tax=Mucilaginibacter aquaedulcis TaxID=1187081 RepID=UPI0025B2DA61|nr:hypothetical protein [Mucilaginibacter aquaedulcis]MDN3549421.1 hypothetical protein [Mucilaginibacter aquaedulcis]
MPKSPLPTYAIVELLIRLSQYNHLIGNYKNHSVFDTGVVVKTSSGSVKLPLGIVQRQFENPGSISDSELATLALLFKHT